MRSTRTADAFARRLALLASNTLRDLAAVPGIAAPELADAIARMADETRRVGRIAGRR